MAYDAHNFQFRYECLNGRVREKDGMVMRSVRIPSDTPVIVKDAADIVKLIEDKKTLLVCFGFTDCPWCRVLIEPLCQTANFLEEPFYYCDIKTIRDVWELEDGVAIKMQSGSKDYEDLLRLLDPVLDEWYLSDESHRHVDTGIKHIFSPCIIAIKDGVPLAQDSCTPDTLDDGYAPLTPFQRQEMVTKIRRLYEMVMEDD